jgi:chromosome partitioning related protein ParA
VKNKIGSPQAAPKNATVSTTVISVVNTKGGAGKTTTAANLGGLAAALGQRVLLIDADMQPALTKFFVIRSPKKSPGMNQVISRGGVILDDDIVETAVPNLWMIPSNMEDHAQAWLKEREDRLILLKRAVRQPIIRDRFDLVIIDTQGAKGELQRTAAMAADVMLTPIKPDMLTYNEFVTGTLEMLGSLNAMSDLLPELRAGQLAIFINAMPRTTNARMVEEQIREQFRAHPSIRLLDTKVPYSTVYEQCRSLRCPVHEIDVVPSVVMHRLLHEVMPNLKGLWLPGHEPQPVSSQQHAGEAA